jgi:hypothetical protein
MSRPRRRDTGVCKRRCRTRYYSEDTAYLLELEQTVTHYDVLTASLPPGLVLRQFGREFPMTNVGEGRFLIQRPGAAEPQRVIIGFTAGGGRAEYVQFAVWAFKRVPGDWVQFCQRPR